MKTLQDIFKTSVNGALIPSDAARKKLALDLHSWLSFRAPKAQVKDLPAALNIWRMRIEHLANTVEIEFDGKALLVKVRGEADDTLRQLDRGGSWFGPCEGVREIIIGTLLA